MLAIQTLPETRTYAQIVGAHLDSGVDASAPTAQTRSVSFPAAEIAEKSSDALNMEIDSVSATVAEILSTSLSPDNDTRHMSRTGIPVTPMEVHELFRGRPQSVKKLGKSPLMPRSRHRPSNSNSLSAEDAFYGQRRPHPQRNLRSLSNSVPSIPEDFLPSKCVNPSTGRLYARHLWPGQQQYQPVLVADPSAMPVMTVNVNISLAIPMIMVTPPSPALMSYPNQYPFMIPQATEYSTYGESIHTFPPSVVNVPPTSGHYAPVHQQTSEIEVYETCERSPSSSIATTSRPATTATTSNHKRTVTEFRIPPPTPTPRSTPCPTPRLPLVYEHPNLYAMMAAHQWRVQKGSFAIPPVYWLFFLPKTHMNRIEFTYI